MSDVRKLVRRRQRDDVLRLPMEERVALALRLGDDDVAFLCSGRGVSEAVARDMVRRQRQRGRALRH